MSSAIKISQVIAAIESVAPPSLAASWDNVGLLLGHREAAVSRVLTCLTLTEDVAEEAAARNIHLIVTHHPILFRGVKRITSDNAEERTILKLAQAGIAVFSPHTCFDDGPGGINEQLATGLGVKSQRPLRSAQAEECKIVVFVPENNLATVADTMFAAGAGVIGQYRECSFRMAGTGTFFGGDTTNPAIGQKGQREEVSEWRLEAVCPKSKLDAVMAAIHSAHSYEEPAVDVYPLVSSNNRGGSGRVGELAGPITLAELAESAKQFLRIPLVQLVGEPTKIVRRVAVACGAAGSFLDDARKVNADVFVTGEMRFHDYLAAQSAGVALLLPGHYATERFAVESLASWLNQKMPGLHVVASERERDPIVFV